MIKDLLVSFKDNIKEKTTNPFLGTLIIVWIIHNYLNLYKLLFSGKELDFESKVIVLNRLLNPRSFLLNLFECIAVSVLVLISTYFLLNLSRLIINFYEKIITPWIYKITDKSSIVLKKDFEKSEYEKEKIQIKFESEREKRIRLESEIEQLEGRIKELMSNKTSATDTQETELNEIDKTIKLIKNKGYLEIFESLIYSISADDWVTEEEAHRFFVTIGLISVKQKSSDERLYGFTERGNELANYYRKKYLYVQEENI
jgi:hypothetical protein